MMLRKKRVWSNNNTCIPDGINVQRKLENHSLAVHCSCSGVPTVRTSRQQYAMSTFLEKKKLNRK